LRFRASGEFNEIIRQASRDENVPLVEMEKAFAENSPNGIPGFELISEHLHPNFDGYFLMAKTFCTAMTENNFIAKAVEWNWQRDKTDQEYKDYSAVTEFDLAVGAYKSSADQPLAVSVTGYDEYGMDESSLTKCASSPLLIRKQKYLGMRRIINYVNTRRKAIRPSRKRISRRDQNHSGKLSCLFQAGGVVFNSGKISRSGGLARQALSAIHARRLSSPNLRRFYFSSESYEKAVAHFDTALALHKMNKEFSAVEAGWAEYYKAMSHLQLGQKKAGMEALTEVVRLQPSNAQAKQLLALLQANADVRLQFNK
jgi:tetratricopeptide (TPR) repeat protein